MLRFAIALLFVLTSLPLFAAAGVTVRVEATSPAWVGQPDAVGEAVMHSPFRVAQPSAAPPLARVAGSGGEPPEGAVTQWVKRDLPDAHFGPPGRPRFRADEDPPRTCETLPYDATAPPALAALLS